MYIRKLLVDMNSPYRQEAFAMLADYYARIGRADTAHGLARNLESK
jgi:hypothetical protein